MLTTKQTGKFRRTVSTDPRRISRRVLERMTQLQQEEKALQEQQMAPKAKTMTTFDEKIVIDRLYPLAGLPMAPKC